MAAWAAVNDQDRNVGARWYADAGELCASLPGGARVGAGVVAALSPRVPWSVNVTAARDLLEGREVRGVLGANLMKARRIAGGEDPEAVLGGPKVRAFFLALLGARDVVVVDVWAARIAGYPPPGTDRQYQIIARAYRTAAKRVGVDPVALQASTWIAARGSAS
jgi:hypothetical protein